MHNGFDGVVFGRQPESVKAHRIQNGIGDVREVSADELIAGIRNKEDDDGSLRRNIWSDLTDDVPAAAKPEPVVAPEPVVPVFEETEPDVYAPVMKMTSEPEVAEAVEPAAEENTEQEQSGRKREQQPQQSSGKFYPGQ